MKALTSPLRAAALSFTLAGIAALPAHAGDAADERGEGSRQSDVGVVTGLAVGALAAGPVGALLGAGAGALIGDGFHRQAKARAALAQDLQHSESERAQLIHSVAQLDGSLSQARSRGDQLDATLQHTDQLSLDVGFRTADDSVTAQAMSPLLKLGALAASMPEARVQVAGYADPRGSDAYNDELSLRRAESVAAVLACAGVPREHILIEAHGRTEAASADGDLDAYALERRVTVRLQLPGAGQVASRD
jgi:outer membrane protein OmpA-like peptidoglycan-associated protein